MSALEKTKLVFKVGTIALSLIIAISVYVASKPKVGYINPEADIKRTLESTKSTFSNALRNR